MLGQRDSRNQFGDKSVKIRELIRSRTQDNDRYVEGREILLKPEIPINGDWEIPEIPLRPTQAVLVLDG